MSYSFKRPCGTCSKKVACMDSSFIMGAISGIHQANYNDAQREVHLGTGTVILDCSRYQDEYAIPISSENKI